tara:strand:+ start:343 stop:2115 length:1773 start_codon:yes stop_codon:yes gene_type:complete
MISKKYRTLISNTGVEKIYFLFFSSIIVVFFEMLGIGSVPVFAYIIIDPDVFFNTLSEKFNISINLEIEKKKLIIISGIIFILIFFLKNLALVMIKYLELRIIKNFKITCAKDIYNYLLEMPYSYHLNTNPADSLRIINLDVDQAFRHLLAKIRLFRECILLIFIATALILIDPLTYSLSFIFFALVATVFYYIYKIVITKRSKIFQEKNAERFQILNQSFNSIKEIKIFNKLNFFNKIFYNNTIVLEKITLFTAFISTIPRHVYELMAVIMIIFFTLVLVLQDYSESSIVPIVALLAASGGRFIPAFNTISASMSSIRFAQPYFKSVISYLNSLNKLNAKKKLKQINQNNSNEAQLPFNNKIEINNLSFDYDGKKILENFSFSIKKGSTIGVIGKSGEGKSTLINLIVGLLKPSSGEILVDDQNIDHNLINWQKKIGYISQDVYLMDDSIKSNICFGLEEEEIDNKNFNKALEQAQIDKFVNGLNEKEHTKIGNLGSRISGGQKQRIAIARALYLNPEILILDEATSSLDTNNENKILSEINQIKANKTIILISHRKNTLASCDDIYLLNDKKISLISKDQLTDIEYKK